MECEPKTFNELRAHYVAVKKRLGGVSGPTGVVPFSRVKLPRAVDAQGNLSPILDVNIPTNRFTRMLREVAAMHGIDPEIVKSPTRKPNVIKVKQEILYKAKNELKMGVSQIGNMLKVSHSTAIYGVKCHEKRIASGANP
jgi:hypothetical protein